MSPYFTKRHINCTKWKKLYASAVKTELMGEYVLRCAGCGSSLPENATSCPLDNGLARTDYAKRRFDPKGLPGIWAFIDWLPISHHNPSTGAGSITYKSTGLAEELDLSELYISFSGYWPERGAFMRTCSFKELEAAPTLQRLYEMRISEVLVVASAGNTARAFAEVCSITGQPLVLFVPSSSLERLWTTVEPGRILVVSVDGDYFEAIRLADTISSREGFIPEGGARNIARRDGMGTVILEHVRLFGFIPDHYFQAIGSGTGGIAAWEASMRLIHDGRFGDTPPRLQLAQNIPCAPVYSLWHDRLSDFDKCPEGMYDDVLFNRSPPYSIPGGVRDALLSTAGTVYGITNQEAERASRMFRMLEGIDILPAAAVAVASLISAVESGEVKRDERILLNITGGGVSRVEEDFERMRLNETIRAGSTDSSDEILNMIRSYME